MDNKIHTQMQDEERQFSKAIKRRRSIFGNRIYTVPKDKNCIYGKPCELFHNIKSAFVTENAFPNNTNYPRYDKELQLQLDINNIDSCTQTSKTILELAKLENESISPDSLMQSPRESELIYNQNCLDLKKISKDLELCFPNVNISCNSYDIDTQNRDFNNKIEENKLYQYKNNCKRIEILPAENGEPQNHTTSLTETFLTKKMQRKSSNIYRSKLFQQFSPLQKLNPSSRNEGSKNKFQSQSLEESNFSDFKTTWFTINAKQNCTAKNQIINHSQKCYQNLQPKMTTEIMQGFHHNGNKNEERVHNYRRENSFMLPTIASEQKNQQHLVQQFKHLISPTRRGKSLSPQRNVVKEAPNQNISIPYTVESNSQLKISTSRSEINPKYKMFGIHGTQLIKDDLKATDQTSSRESTCTNATISLLSTSSHENIISTTINRIRSSDWDTALMGLAEMIELCKTMDTEVLLPHMTAVNQRLIELLRSPRSHVCRTACQAAGHFFECMKDTRRPEFDDIVEILLYKTADANKFIRKDANLSLDCMVTHMPTSHAIRSLSLKGPTHKNPLVRTATIRLIICAVVIVGARAFLSLQIHESARKRIIQNLPKFLTDKHLETRKYGERLCNIFNHEVLFEPCLKKYLERNDLTELYTVLKFKNHIKSEIIKNLKRP